MLDVQVTDDAEGAARVAADLIAHAIVAAVGARGRATVAVSGGETPWRMLEVLATRHLAWDALHVFLVDERVGAPEDERNGPRLRKALAASGLSADHLHLMPAKGQDLLADAAAYEATLRSLSDGVLDCVQLGLGEDGHTASLVPGDPVLDVTDRLVASTAQPYAGYRRITLTYPTLAAARSIVWLVNGERKADVLPRVRAHDPALPAGRVSSERAILVCDTAAAVRLEVT